MALLQIAEPGQSAAPHQHKRAVDLGTTNSLVAAVRSGQADTLCDEQGRIRCLPWVHYQADTIRVGFDAKREAALDPHNTIVSVGRMMGNDRHDTRQQPYEFVATGDGHAPGCGPPGAGQSGAGLGEILKNWPSAVPRPRETSRAWSSRCQPILTMPSVRGTKDAARLAGLRTAVAQRTHGGRHRLWPRPRPGR